MNSKGEQDMPNLGPYDPFEDAAVTTGGRALHIIRIPGHTYCGRRYYSGQVAVASITDWMYDDSAHVRWCQVCARAASNDARRAR